MSTPGNTNDLDEPTAFCCTPFDPETGTFESPKLSPEEWARFYALIENPPPPTPALVDLMKGYRP